MKVKDFMKLCGEKEDKVIFLDDNTGEMIIIPVEDLFHIDRMPWNDIHTVREEYADIMESEIASWEYDEETGFICIHWFS